MRGIGTTVPLPFAEADGAVRRVLSDAGFGVLTEIDVAATLRTKLGVEGPRLTILGACNPELAHRALQADPSVALLLPCNVVLRQEAEDRTSVTVADPRELLPSDGLGDLAEDAAARLQAALDQLAG